MRDPHVVTVRGLSKSYGGRKVLDGLDLDVEAGQIVGLIGANGAGKTTTVECIQGLRRADAGTIRTLGLDPVADRRRLLGLIGTQLQQSELPDRLRVGEAVALFDLRGADNGEALLEQFGLIDRRRAAFGTLSGGERQRLFLVLALLGRPRLVILDELTQGLDPSARREVWSAVAQVRDSGATVLLVTHELDEAEALCDTVVAMRAGRVLDQGAPADLVDRHGPFARIRFTLADEALALDELRRLPGVHDVTRQGARAVIRGDRGAIAHVGAALLAAGRVPADLRVELPDLEEALVALLHGPGDPARTSTLEPIGAAA